MSEDVWVGRLRTLLVVLDDLDVGGMGIDDRRALRNATEKAWYDINAYEYQQLNARKSDA